MLDPQPLFDFLDEPASVSSLVVGSTVGLVMSGMLAVSLLALPLLRTTSLMAAIARRSGEWLRRLLGRNVLPGEAPPRPLAVDGLSPPLARLARQTRTLALELRRRSEEARHWPDDAAELEPESSRWWRSLIDEGVDFTALVDTRREVFDWLVSLDELGAGDRATLGELGVHGEAVRELLTRPRLGADEVRGLAGLLWGFDQRLAGASTAGYRATAAEGRGWRAVAFDDGRDEDEGEAPDEVDLDERARRAALVNAHRRRISAIAGSFSRNSAEREDLEQDISLALWQALPKFRGESSLATFVSRVAQYCCYRRVRRRGRLRVELGEDPASFPDPDGGPEAWLADLGERERVRRAVSELPEGLESALSLHLSGLSYAEIADRLGISEGNVSVRLTRARHRLRAQLVAA